ncbi:hypothetical protein, partial [Ferrimicrobium sp.]
LAVNPRTDTVYAEGATSVSVINGATDRVVHVIRVHSNGLALAVNPTTNMVYVARHNEYDAFYGKKDANVVTVINGATDRVVNTIDVNDDTMGIEGIEVDPTINMVLANGATSVSVINGATDRVVQVLPVNGGSLALDPTTNMVYAETGKRSVSVIALAAGIHPAASSSNLWPAAGIGIWIVVVGVGGTLLAASRRRRIPRGGAHEMGH